MHAHGLFQQHSTSTSTDSNGVVHETFESCDWPPPAYADQTGYSRVTLTDYPLTGGGEAEDDTWLSIFDSTCTTIYLTYQLETQGVTNPEPPFTVGPGVVTRVDSGGATWAPGAGILSNSGIYLTPTQSAVFHNDKDALISAACS